MLDRGDRTANSQNEEDSAESSAKMGGGTKLATDERWTSEPDDEGRYFEKYKLMVDYVFYQDNQYWLVYSIFIASMGLILSMFAQAYQDISPMMRLGSSFFGLLMCIVWLIICSRSIAYRNDRMSRALKILDKTSKGKLKDECLELWDKEEKLAKIQGTGIFGWSSSTTVSIAFIYVSIVIWGSIFSYELSKAFQCPQPFDTVVVIFAVLMVILGLIDAYLKYKYNPLYPNRKELSGGGILKEMLKFWEKKR